MRALTGGKYRSVALSMLLMELMFLSSCATVRLTFLGVLAKDLSSKENTCPTTPVAVGGTITGRIVASDGTTPVSGAEVAVSQSDGLYFGSATASADGTYKIDDLPRGIYKVSVTAQGFVEETRTDVRVAKGRTTSGIDFSSVKTGSISGKVTEIDGVTPIGEIEVTAFDTSSRGFGSVVTSGDGTYLIDDLSPGKYTEVVMPPGFIAASRTGIPVTTDQVTPNVDFSLPRSGSISGTVTEKDGTTPIRKAEILVFEPNGGAGLSVSDTNGTYRVSGLAQGECEVTVTAAGYMRTSKAGVTVTSGEEIGNLDFHLSRGSSISGRVSTAEGMTPRKGISVVAIKGKEVAGYASTKEDGSYTLEGLSEGTYDVELQDGDTVITGVKLTDGQVVTGVDFLMRAAASVSGKVVERTWGAPGSMDTQYNGCSMKPEVHNEFGEKATQELYA